MTPRNNRHFARKGERGTAVVVVVMVTTLITAIGVFAVRNVTQIDMAVGYSRQAAQTNALAELGTTAAMAEIADTGARYSTEMSRRDSNDRLKPAFRCAANGGAIGPLISCYPLAKARIEENTTSHGGETLLEPTVSGADTGSFGPLAQMQGSVVIELTEKRPTDVPIGGARAGDSAFDVTVTTTGIVNPITATECGDSVSTMTVKKVMRAHVIIPPEPGI